MTKNPTLFEIQIYLMQQLFAESLERMRFKHDSALFRETRANICPGIGQSKIPPKMILKFNYIEIGVK
jgi:hypothetical protein